MFSGGTIGRGFLDVGLRWGRSFGYFWGALALVAGPLLLGATVEGFRGASYGRELTNPHRTPVGAPPAVAGLRRVELGLDSGASVRGWYVPSRNRAAVVLAHGHTANRSQMSAELALLAARGFGVLAFDFPGHGESDGERVTWGPAEREALRTAIEFVGRQSDVEPSRVGVMGFSMGAVVAIQEASENPSVKALVSAGAFTALDEQVALETSHWGRIGSFFAFRALRWNGVEPGRNKATELIARIAPRPVLLVHGTKDPFVPVENEQRLFALAGWPKSQLVIPGAPHGGYAQVDPERYAAVLGEFFETALLGDMHTGLTSGAVQSHL